MKAIKVKKEVLSVWNEEIQITISNAKACNIAYNTLKNAIQSGICTQTTHDKINSFLLKQRTLLKKVLR